MNKKLKSALLFTACLLVGLFIDAAVNDFVFSMKGILFSVVSTSVIWAVVYWVALQQNVGRKRTAKTS